MRSACRVPIRRMSFGTLAAPLGVLPSKAFAGVRNICGMRCSGPQLARFPGAGRTTEGVCDMRTTKSMTQNVYAARPRFVICGLQQDMRARGFCDRSLTQAGHRDHYRDG